MLLIADNRLPRSRRRSTPPPKRCSGRDPAPGGDTAAASSRGAGVLRLHYAPAALPAAQGQVGPNRLNDPRPYSLERYVVRYTASTLRGCLLGSLDWLRPNPQAALR